MSHLPRVLADDEGARRFVKIGKAAGATASTSAPPAKPATVRELVCTCVEAPPGLVIPSATQHAHVDDKPFDLWPQAPLPR